MLPNALPHPAPLCSLLSAVSSLPELTERKRTLDKHTNIATALLQEIKRRNLDQFHGIEEDMLAGQAKSSRRSWRWGMGQLGWVDVQRWFEKSGGSNGLRADAVSAGLCRCLHC